MGGWKSTPLLVINALNTPKRTCRFRHGCTMGDETFLFKDSQAILARFDTVSERSLAPRLVAKTLHQVKLSARLFPEGMIKVAVAAESPDPHLSLS